MLHSVMLRGEIEDGTPGIHVDNLDGAKKGFYESVREAAAKLNKAVTAHNEGFMAAYHRLPATNHWDEGRRTGNRGSILKYGKGDYDYELNFMRSNGGGRAFVTAQHPGVSGLEIFARPAIFEAVHGAKLSTAPNWVL